MFARRPEFDEIRRFIRYGEGDGSHLVSVKRASVLIGPGAGTSRTHGIGFEWMPDWMAGDLLLVCSRAGSQSATRLTILPSST